MKLVEILKKKNPYLEYHGIVRRHVFLITYKMLCDPHRNIHITKMKRGGGGTREADLENLRKTVN